MSDFDMRRASVWPHHWWVDGRGREIGPYEDPVDAAEMMEILNDAVAAERDRCEQILLRCVVDLLATEEWDQPVERALREIFHGLELRVRLEFTPRHLTEDGVASITPKSSHAGNP